MLSISLVRAHFPLLLALASAVSLSVGCGDGRDTQPLGTVGVGDTGGTNTGGTGGTGGIGGAGGTGGTGGTGATGGMGGASAIPDTCFNNLLDPDETEKDCGGPCGLCGGEPCALPVECASGLCEMSECTVANCTDGVQNSGETGVDCGPGCTAKCLDGEGCNDDIHCQSAVCEMSLCQVPDCMDNTTNGGETDVDCGGMSGCGPCGLGQKCIETTDCVSEVCTGPTANKSCACPSKMVISTTQQGSFCVDKTEVTYDEYEDFWFANPSAVGQIAECSWNVNWTPGLNWPQTDSRHPIVGVNWCQAYAYCEWAGKRLCGKFGGGAVAFNDFADHTSSQWQNACSANGTNIYPYGQTYNGATCNGADAAEGTTVEVQNAQGTPNSMTTSCEGGSPTLWQMSGNVREWENACNDTTGQNDSCRLRGGSFNSTASALTCAASDSAARNLVADDIGFRCCVGG
jgi:formylglycine-generating enzyme